MKIGIIGNGFVGSAIMHGFVLHVDDIMIYDKNPKRSTHSMNDLVNEADVIFICVPTPMFESGECDLSIVESVSEELSQYSCINKKVVVIKSTVVPGTTRKLIKKYDNNKICHVPEFLRERFAYEDFVDNHNVLVVGSDNTSVSEIVVESHGHLPKSVRCLEPQEAELVKYFSNSYKASKIIFANSFAELCKNEGVDYELVKDTYLLHGVREHEYFSVTDELRGFGGACLPKDVSALNGYVDQNDIDIKLFDFLINENKKFTTWPKNIFSWIKQKRNNNIL